MGNRRGAKKATATKLDEVKTVNVKPEETVVPVKLSKEEDVKTKNVSGTGGVGTSLGISQTDVNKAVELLRSALAAGLTIMPSGSTTFEPKVSDPTDININDTPQSNSTVLEGKPKPVVIEDETNTTIKARELIAAMPNILSVKNQSELLDKIRASTSESLLHIMPSKEINLEMIRGINVDELLMQNKALIAVSRKTPTIDRVIKRGSHVVSERES